jgi:hypothetical protein
MNQLLPSPTPLPAPRGDAFARNRVASRGVVRGGDDNADLCPRNRGQYTSQPGRPDGLASQPTLYREVETLSSVRNRCVLRQGLRRTAARNLRASGRIG